MIETVASRPARVWRRLAVAVAALGVAVLPATTAVAQSSPSPGTAEKTFTIGYSQDIDTLNPFAGFLSISYEVYADVYDLLTGWSQKDFSPVPGIAESWTASPDGKTWTFKIRSGVKWSDGQPLTAKDVAYTFNRVVNGETENAAFYNYVANLKKVTAPDDTTAVFELSAADPIMTHMWVPILPEHIWKNVSEKDAGTFDNKEMVGTGAFQLVEQKPGEFIKLKANKSYWGGAPKIDNLIYRIFKNDDAMAQALQKGEIDAVADIGANQFLALKDKPGITTVQATGLSFSELGFNTGAATTDNQPVGDGHPALKDKALRQAIGYAIDQQTIVNKVLRGLGKPGVGVIPPVYSAYKFDPGASARTFDIAKANSLLDAAGYTKGSDGIRVDPKSGKKLDFRLFGRTEDENSKGVVPYIQDWMNQIGIKTKVQFVTDDKLTDIIAHGNYEMFTWGWGVEPDPGFQLSTFTCDQRDSGTAKDPVAGWSDSFYCNPAYDALYQQQSNEIDPAKRAELVKQMQQMIYDDAPYIVTYYVDSLEAYRSDKWTGVQRQPTDGGNVFFQYGTYSYRNLDLVSAQEDSGGGGLATGVIVGIGVAAAALVAGGVVAFARRRSTADERE
jgi:peptide/nickel transport system substrate-binding protein